MANKNQLRGSFDGETFTLNHVYLFDVEGMGQRICVPFNGLTMVAQEAKDGGIQTEVFNLTNPKSFGKNAKGEVVSKPNPQFGAKMALSKAQLNVFRNMFRNALWAGLESANLKKSFANAWEYVLGMSKSKISTKSTRFVLTEFTGADDEALYAKEVGESVVIRHQLSGKWELLGCRECCLGTLEAKKATAESQAVAD